MPKQKQKSRLPDDRSQAEKKSQGGAKNRKKRTQKPTPKTKNKKGTAGKPRVSSAAYQVDSSFELFDELRALLIKAMPESFPELEKKLKRLGRMKLVVVTGAFLNINDARIDLLLVGDGIRLQKLTSAIKDIEAELGKEIRYVILSVSEFKYRHEMYDRFLRDILSSPHEKIINRLKV